MCPETNADEHDGTDRTEEKRYNFVTGASTNDPNDPRCHPITWLEKKRKI